MTRRLIAGAGLFVGTIVVVPMVYALLAHFDAGEGLADRRSQLQRS